MAISGINDLEKDLKIINDYVDELLSKNLYNPNNTISGDSPLKNYKSYVDLILQKINSDGNTFFINQASFKLMNPGPGKILNPIIAGGPPPGAVGFVTDSFDTQLIESVPVLQDVITNAISQTNFETSIGAASISAINNKQNIFNDKETTEDFILFNNDAPETPGQPGTKLSEPIGNIKYDIPNYEDIFTRKLKGPGFLNEDKGYLFYEPKLKIRIPTSIRQKKQAIENDDVFFTQEDFSRGFIEDDINHPLLGESSNYMPFFFEDLRKLGRRIYFRAFLTNFREGIVPTWNQENYFGRVDPVPQYKNTTRTFAVGFKIAAMSPAGFSSMWRKINNLSKMCYPMFSNGSMIASPVLRLRIGDVCCDSSGLGLPGYISSELSLDYTNMPWEISAWNGPLPFPTENNIELGKAPMVAELSFTFTVIHEVNPAIDDIYNFTTDKFRRVGSIEDNVPQVTISQEEVENTTEVEPNSVADNQGSTRGGNA